VKHLVQIWYFPVDVSTSPLTYGEFVKTAFGDRAYCRTTATMATASTAIVPRTVPMSRMSSASMSEV